MVENHQNYQEINERRVLPTEPEHPLQLTDRSIWLKKSHERQIHFIYRITKLQFVILRETKKRNEDNFNTFRAETTQYKLANWFVQNENNRSEKNYKKRKILKLYIRDLKSKKIMKIQLWLTQPNKKNSNNILHATSSPKQPDSDRDRSRS